MTSTNEPESLDLSFVHDDMLRQILEGFHREAADDYRNGAYRSALILSGAVLEGVLTHALTLRPEDAEDRYRELFPRKPEFPESQYPPPPGQWNLAQLIRVAVKLDLVGDTAEKGAWAVKDFRNFIHPNNLLGRSPPRWRALARSALAAIEDVTGSLSGRLGAV